MIAEKTKRLRQEEQSLRMVFSELNAKIQKLMDKIEGKENNHGDGNEVASTNEAYQHKTCMISLFWSINIDCNCGMVQIGLVFVTI